MLPGFTQFPEGQVLAFALVLLRLSAFVVVWPIFGTTLVPTQVKILLALSLAVVMAPVAIPATQATIVANSDLPLLALREVLIGVFLGYLLRFIFFAVQMAGEMIGVSTGLATAQVFNPAMGSQGNVFEQYHVILATLLLLALDGHHVFLEGIARSFTAAPIGIMEFNREAFQGVSLALQTVFAIAIRLAGPILVSMFAVNLAMGLMGRAVPQMNVLMTSLQVTILISLFVVFVASAVFVDEMSGILSTMAQQFFAVLKVI